MLDKGDWYHLVPDEIVVKRFTARGSLKCLCCGTEYLRGQFRCCVPPAGMASQYWLALSCPMPDQGGCGKCAHHCECPNKRARLGKGPLANLAEEFLAGRVKGTR